MTKGRKRDPHDILRVHRPLLRRASRLLGGNEGRNEGGVSPGGVSAGGGPGTRRQRGFGSRVRLSASLLGATTLGLALWAGAIPVSAEVKYQTKFEGVADGDLKDDLNDASQLVKLEDNHPPTEAALRRRGQDDLVRLKSVMESAGYYDAQLSLAIDESKKPLLATVKIEPGERYMLHSVTLRTPDGKPPAMMEAFDPAAYGLKLGGPALAPPVVDAEAKIVRYYADHGYPNVAIDERHITVDLATHRMDVVYVVKTGARANFGTVQVVGLTRLQEDWVRRRIDWGEGTLYDQSKVDTVRQNMVSSGLFGSVAITPSGLVGPDGTIPIQVKLVERALHSITVGGSYNTSQGLAANVTWEHRDLFGGGEDLKLTGIAGTEDNGASAVFRRPDLWATNQDLVAQISFDDQLEDAFRSRHAKAQLGLERKLDPDWLGPNATAGAALLGERARIDEKVDIRNYTLTGVPLYLHKDGSNDLLNPTSGYRINLDVTPYTTLMGGDLDFTQAKLVGTYYRKLSRNDDYVLAVMGQLGATVGTSLDSIPKDHRFFAGGGGSVRGFGYQKASPIDKYYNPIGGRSLSEVSLELRMKVTETIGIVPFFDAGQVYESSFPSFDRTPFMGVGIGARYYTSIGPVRLDVATPVNPRSQGDAPIQLYVSLGQAF